MRRIGSFLLTAGVLYFGVWVIALAGPIACNAIFGFLQSTPNLLIFYKICLYIVGLYLPFCILIWFVGRMSWTYGPGIASVVAYLVLFLPLIFNDRFVARGMEIESQLTYWIVGVAPIAVFYLSGYLGVQSRKHNQSLEQTA